VPRAAPAPGGASGPGLADTGDRIRLTRHHGRKPNMLHRTSRALIVMALSVATLTTVLAAGAVAAKSTTVKVEIDDEGCPAKLTTKAGPNTFKVSNTGSSGDVSEFEIVSGSRIIGEIENIAPGLNGEFSLTLKPGTYATKCPGGSEHSTGKLKVRGTTATKLSSEGKAAVDQYRAYLVAQTAELVAATKTFTDAVDAGDVDAAKAAYPAARLPYERIEPVAETFGDLDPEIDAREGDVPAKQWGGFHRIEQALWVDGSTAGLDPEVTSELNEHVERLQNLVKDVELQPAAIANGSVELLNEVSSSKITGEEERYSRIDLVDFEGNVQGSQAAFEAVKPILVKKHPALANDIDAKFAAVTAALAPYRTGATFVAYTDLTSDDTKALSTVIDALAEPLSKVGKQVVGT
jgi:iron uptake system component EfeO